MATSLSRSSVPPELRAVYRQFEQWRRIREAGARIPDDLWASAVVVARRHGVYRTARLLHLEERKLKQLVSGANPAPRASMTPTFVEVPMPLAAGSAECTIEIDGPHGGRLRVQLRGTALPDLVALSRVMWSSGA